MMFKTDRLALCLFAAVFLAIGAFFIVLATSHAPAEPVSAQQVDAPNEPEPEPQPSPAPPEPIEPADDDRVDADEPADDQPAEPESVSPACCKECNAFGMDRPNCLAADCHCSDGCPCDEMARCCPECLCDLKPKPQPEPTQPPSDPPPPPKLPVRGPAWFYCLACRQYSHYTARAALRTTQCRQCGQWGAYRTLVPPKPVESYDQPDGFRGDSRPGFRQWKPFGGFGSGFGFGDAGNGQACAGST